MGLTDFIAYYGSDKYFRPLLQILTQARIMGPTDFIPYSIMGLIHISDRCLKHIPARNMSLTQISSRIMILILIPARIMGLTDFIPYSIMGLIHISDRCLKHRLQPAI